MISMKNLILILILTTTINLTSQNTRGKANDAGRIVLNTFVEDLENIPQAAMKLLKNKISQIASGNGMGGNESFPRFIISADVDVLTKDITPTAPPKTALTLAVNLYIGDGIEGTIFASEYIELKGIANNDTKAFIQSFRALSPRNKKFNYFIESGKRKIIEYYNSKCDFILKEANTLADQKDFDNSISKLIEIPEVCKDCYDKAMDLSTSIFKRKMENECQQNITKSNSFIAQDNWLEAPNPISNYTPDMTCYSEVKSLLDKIVDHKCAISLGKAKGAWASRDSKSASSALSEISFDSSCYKEAQALFKAISNDIDAKEKRDWDLQYEKYNRDQVVKEIIAETNRLDSNSRREINELDSDSRRKINELDSDSQRRVNEINAQNKTKEIEAMRQVGIAYAENQPRVKYKLLK